MENMNITLTVTGSAFAIAKMLAAVATPDEPTAMTDDAPIFAPPAPVPAMPFVAPPAPVPAMPVATGETDVDGLPWDERIHTSTKGRNADGRWKKKKGALGLVAAVEAELRARLGVAAAPVPVAPPPAPVPAAIATIPMPSPMPVVAPPAPEPVAAIPMPVAAIPMPTPEALPELGAGVVIPAPPPPGSLDFSGFMQHLAGQMKKQGADGLPLIHGDYLGQVTKEVGDTFGVVLNAITDIQANPQMIAHAAAVMTRDGRWS